MLSLFQAPLKAGLPGAGAHVDVPVHGYAAVVVLAAAVGGVDLSDGGEGLVVGGPVFAAAAELIGEMMGDSYRGDAAIAVSQLLITHGVEHGRVVVQEEDVVVSVLAGALPFIAHKHGESIFICLLDESPQGFPVGVTYRGFVNILQAQSRRMLPHMEGIVGDGPEIHEGLDVVIPLGQLIKVLMVEIGVHIGPQKPVLHRVLPFCWSGLHDAQRHADGGDAQDQENDLIGGPVLLAHEPVAHQSEDQGHQAGQDLIQDGGLDGDHHLASIEGPLDGGGHGGGSHAADDDEAYDVQGGDDLILQPAVEQGGDGVHTHGVALDEAEILQQDHRDGPGEVEEDGAQRGAVGRQADADGKQDGVVSTHQDGVADAGEGAHKGALGGVDDLGLHGLAVGLGLLESQGHAGDQGAQLGLGVEEGHVPGQSLGKALLIVAVQLLQGLGQGGAEGEAHHTLVVLAAVVEEGPVPCGLGYVLFGQLTHRSRPPQSKSDCCWPRRRPGWRCHCPWP